MSLDLGTPNQWMLHLDLDLRLAAAALLVARPKLGRETPIDTATWGVPKIVVPLNGPF